MRYCKKCGSIYFNNIKKCRCCGASEDVESVDKVNLSIYQCDFCKSVYHEKVTSCKNCGGTVFKDISEIRSITNFKDNPLSFVKYQSLLSEEENGLSIDKKIDNIRKINKHTFFCIGILIICYLLFTFLSGDLFVEDFFERGWWDGIGGFALISLLIYSPIIIWDLIWYFLDYKKQLSNQGSKIKSKEKSVFHKLTLINICVVGRNINYNCIWNRFRKCLEKLGECWNIYWTMDTSSINIFINFRNIYKSLK